MAGGAVGDGIGVTDCVVEEVAEEGFNCSLVIGVVVVIVLFTRTREGSGRGTVESVNIVSRDSMGGRCCASETLTLCLGVMMTGLCLGSCGSVVAIARDFEGLPLL